MPWLWRMFKAPGENDEPLPISSSSWSIGRVIQMLEGHWNTLVEFASKIDPKKADLLDTIVQSRADSEQTIAVEDFNSMIGFIEDVIRIIEMPDTKKLEPSEDNPDAFENNIYVDMLEAVNAVFKESVRLNKSFESWVDYT